MRDEKHIYDETHRSTAAISAVTLEEREHERGRDRKTRTKDAVQEEADRHYRETVVARKLAEEQIRSRSASPERSVMEKWQEEEQEPVIRIVTPPEMDKKPEQSPYDGPNADVRIDNKIFPEGTTRFRVSGASTINSTDLMV